MPTNDERREVAANIRNAANSAKDDLQDNPNYSAFAVVYVVSCGVRRSFPRYEDLMYLADLVEPAPERTCRNLIIDINRRTPLEYRTDNFLCSACKASYDADSEHINHPIDWPYCPNCGAKVVDDEGSCE